MKARPHANGPRVKPVRMEELDWRAQRVERQPVMKLPGPNYSRGIRTRDVYGTYGCGWDRGSHWKRRFLTEQSIELEAWSLPLGYWKSWGFEFCYHDMRTHEQRARQILVCGDFALSAGRYVGWVSCDDPDFNYSLPEWFWHWGHGEVMSILPSRFRPEAERIYAAVRRGTWGRTTSIESEE